MVDGRLSLVPSSSHRPCSFWCVQKCQVCEWRICQDRQRGVGSPIERTHFAQFVFFVLNKERYISLCKHSKLQRLGRNYKIRPCANFFVCIFVYMYTKKRNRCLSQDQKFFTVGRELPILQSHGPYHFWVETQEIWLCSPDHFLPVGTCGHETTIHQSTHSFIHVT